MIDVIIKEFSESLNKFMDKSIEKNKPLRPEDYANKLLNCQTETIAEANQMLTDAEPAIEEYYREDHYQKEDAYKKLKDELNKEGLKISSMFKIKYSE